MRKYIFLLLIGFSYVCADITKIPLAEDPNIKFLQQKLYSEEIVINGKKEILYNIVEFYCYEGLVIVKLPNNSIKYVGNDKTLSNLRCEDFKSWERELDEN